MTEIINKKLKNYILQLKGDTTELAKAMDYSLNAGGKRLRPQLVLEFAALCGGKPENALPIACAIEMIHTYSLIHDDLPCMDNDDYRRGKPSNHKRFGQSTALLAGDALLTLAFEVALNDEAVEKLGLEPARSCAFELAKAAGANGMCMGQALDLKHEGSKITAKVLEEIHAKKTGALISASCVMGCIAAEATVDEVEAARQYGQKLGLCFQIIDDVLDVTSTAETLGKPIGSDIASGKTTYVTLFGVDKCLKLADKLTTEALELLQSFNGNTEPLVNLTKTLLARDK
ncbi:MAG: polyprenyl synthetase family protein [Oscillospiraceae bacterium]|nr:polyprenyl synthetase family protein [Oscillospiraceae bacterium]